MTEKLERRYRSVLRVAAPAGFRERHGDELIDTLLETAAPGQTRPSARETLGIVRAGLDSLLAPSRRRSAGQTWIGGLQVAVLFLYAISAHFDLDDIATRGWIARPAFAGLMLAWLAPYAVIRGRFVVAFGLAAASEVIQSWYTPISGWNLVLAVVLIAVLAVTQRGRPRPRLSGGWLLAVPIGMFVLSLPGWVSSWHTGWVGWLPFGQLLWLAILAPLVVAGFADARLAIAASVVPVVDALDTFVSVIPVHSGGSAHIVAFVVDDSQALGGIAWALGAAALFAAAGHLTARRRVRL